MQGFLATPSSMRLQAASVETIRRVVRDEAGLRARVRLFGSRLDDAARGGDVDLLVELPEAPAHPALLAARVAGRVSRAMHGRRVDVLLAAPGLRRLPIHDIAEREGVLL